jgi:hypothetical protein
VPTLLARAFAQKALGMRLRSDSGPHQQGMFPCNMLEHDSVYRRRACSGAVKSSAVQPARLDACSCPSVCLSRAMRKPVRHPHPGLCHGSPATCWNGVECAASAGHPAAREPVSATSERVAALRAALIATPTPPINGH